MYDMSLNVSGYLGFRIIFPQKNINRDTAGPHILNEHISRDCNEFILASGTVFLIFCQIQSRYLILAYLG